MMPHLKGRPVSLVKAPQGIAKPAFFQKHLDKVKLQGVESLDPKLSPGDAAFFEIAKPIGLLSAAQMNTIEFHTWNATKKKIEQPDRMVFDLDPGKGAEWSSMQQAAELMRGFLEKLGLEAFLKTSGGKGLHVVVPIKPQVRVGYGEGLLAGRRREDGDGAAAALRGEERAEEPRRQDLHRLPAQRPRSDDRGGVERSRAAWHGHLRSRSAGRSCRSSRAAINGRSPTPTRDSASATIRGRATRRPRVRSMPR